jgi:hypothetical protein
MPNVIYLDQAATIPLDERMLEAVLPHLRNGAAQSGLPRSNPSSWHASATGHCLTGCGIGEVLELIIADTLGWGNVASILDLLLWESLAIALAAAFPVNR